MHSKCHPEETHLIHCPIPRTTPILRGHIIIDEFNFLCSTKFRETHSYSPGNRPTGNRIAYWMQQICPCRCSICMSERELDVQPICMESDKESDKESDAKTNV
jgi:hypothetical protein